MIQGAAFRILGCFYKQDVRNFAELCKEASYPTDLGGYYIRQLIKDNYIEKADRGEYRLRPEGKRELALRYGKKLHAMWPRLCVMLVVKQDNKYITLERKAQPFVGSVEWPAAAVIFGEGLTDAAKRNASERLGLDIEPKLSGFFRRIDVYDQTVFDDKLFAVHTFSLESGIKFNDTCSLGNLNSYNEEQLRQLPNRAKALLDIYDFVASGGGNTEHTYNLVIKDFSL